MKRIPAKYEHNSHCIINHKKNKKNINLKLDFTHRQCSKKLVCCQSCLCVLSVSVLQATGTFSSFHSPDYAQSSKRETPLRR